MWLPRTLALVRKLIFGVLLLGGVNLPGNWHQLMIQKIETNGSSSCRQIFSKCLDQIIRIQFHALLQIKNLLAQKPLVYLSVCQKNIPTHNKTGKYTGTGLCSSLSILQRQMVKGTGRCSVLNQLRFAGFCLLIHSELVPDQTLVTQ